ncbi:MAG: short-chain dehydrogenase/reductase SDR [Candidatus Thermofonsia Clade 1 bacterium]|uniref:Short-chain dehydrogenase/reductase SDR n=1 Tax=Candidatus Thermofonsia Clade 1 bacterium TaxID=2364210 RepID=A0A2M8PZ85_9CHLR|nr:MAG: short-chain dehydrogenase/reductase SDR [Candidatus Thermofonsia Clade 1 bacterium]PJF42867.1 MAG: short-chain dehydrogenase/reductase SDR [Candidatus Thermofonsia Clade 1 bacterium]RMF50507.1 MAG: SDR family oxidoreductase [Chloroflexota bacterium]
MNSLTGKVALVTGAGMGIGYALCRALAEAGATVALNDIDAERATQAAEQLNQQLQARRVHAYAADVADVNAMRAIVGQIAARFARLDIAIANAGITLFGRFLEYEPEPFDRLLAVNLRGSFFTAQAAAREMIRRQIEGRIILMSSVAGVQAIGGLGAYGISKAGLRMMARTLAYELGAYGITVNALAPGATLTERTAQETANYEQDWRAVTPNRRVAHVEDIAAAALFLCSEGARHINGQTLIVDGGWTNQSPLPLGY